MMYILGILSIFQIIFLPGLIFLKITKTSGGFLQRLIYGFAYSLIFNHIYVLLITYLGVNTPVVHYIIFLIEIFILIYLYRADFRTSFGDQVETWIQNLRAYIIDLANGLGSGKNSLSTGLMSFLTLFFFAWAVVSVSWSIRQLVDNLGSVFTIWDSVVSWNSWAVEWFSNTVPLETYRYPQLIPTNFSLTYSFMGSSTLQIFAKGFMPIFAVFFLLLMLDLGLTKRSLAYFIGIVVSQYLLKRFYLIHIGSGYVDVALVFFTFLAVHPLLKAEKTDNEEEKLNFALSGFIFAAGAGLTKQNGLFVLGIYPLLAYLFVFRDLKSLSNSQKFKRLLTYTLISATILAPWYIFNEIRILQGAKTNVLLLSSQDHHAGRSMVERLTKAYKDLSIYVYLYPLVLITLPFMKKEAQRIILLILLPYSLIWAFFFSLYPRNLSIGLALLGFASGHAAVVLVHFGMSLIKKIKLGKVPLIIVLIGILGPVFLSAIVFSDPILLELQSKGQKSALDADLNSQIYAYFDDHGNLEPIFTNYPLRFIPGFEDLQIDIGGFEDYGFYLQKRAEYPEVEYMLISLYKDNGKVVNEIYDGVELGLYEVIFKQKKYLFVRILND